MPMRASGLPRLSQRDESGDGAIDGRRRRGGGGTCDGAAVRLVDAARPHRRLRSFGAGQRRGSRAALRGAGAAAWLHARRPARCALFSDAARSRSATALLQIAAAADRARRARERRCRICANNTPSTAPMRNPPTFGCIDAADARRTGSRAPRSLPWKKLVFLPACAHRLELSSPGRQPMHGAHPAAGSLERRPSHARLRTSCSVLRSRLQRELLRLRRGRRRARHELLDDALAPGRRTRPD